MNTTKYMYWISTAVMCGIFLFSASMYFTKTEMVRSFFDQLGYPSYLVIPLAILKVLGVIAVVSRKSKLLTEWAYAGFFLDAVLAFVAHYVAQDGGSLFSIIAICSTLVSRFLLFRL